MYNPQMETFVRVADAGIFDETPLARFLDAVRSVVQENGR